MLWGGVQSEWTVPCLRGSRWKRLGDRGCQAGDFIQVFSKQNFSFLDTIGISLVPRRSARDEL